MSGRNEGSAGSPDVAKIGSSTRAGATPTTQPAGAISIRGLTVTVAGQPLLVDADAEFPAGEVTLVIGASGAGKSVLMRLLAGLEEVGVVEATGSVEIAGKRVRFGRRGEADLGLVFQNFALFDEFSSRQNIEFAIDHARRQPSKSTSRTSDKLLEEFQIPKATPVQSLSGGQKQRLAVARTLAYDPAIIMYDEPTSGLDPANAARVAERIRNTADAHGKTTLIATHDYENLAGIADNVVLLDPDVKKLRRLEAAELDDLAAHLPGVRVFQEQGGDPLPRLPARLLRSVGRALELSGETLERSLVTLVHLLPFWRSPRWGCRFFLHYLSLLASPSAWVYFAVAGLIAGFVSTYFSFKFLPHRPYTQPLIADELLQGLGYVLYRTVVPILTTILIAARAGAAIASDIGNRAYGQQLDAMTSFGVRPSRYLLTNVLYAFVVATPFLVAVCFFVARCTSVAVFVFSHPEKGADFWDVNFHHDLRVAGDWFYFGSGWLLAKVLICGLGVGAIAYHVSSSPKKSGVAVSRAITSTIIWATIYVLSVHFGFAFFEFEDFR